MMSRNGWSRRRILNGLIFKKQAILPGKKVVGLFCFEVQPNRLNLKFCRGVIPICIRPLNKRGVF